jgi:serine/threonine protein kinase
LQKTNNNPDPLRPTIGDYIGALENPAGVFRTLRGVEVERDVYGAPLFYAGNSAAVFTFRNTRGGHRFLKCYIRPNPHLRTIYQYIERQRPALLPGVRLLRDELFVHTHSDEAAWVDIVEGEWSEGETLAAAVARAAYAGDGERLAALADAFDALRDELARAEWAHGDLKPENIIVSNGLHLRLIDCDAMWIPPLAGQPAAELGTPPWSDPERTADRFDKTIDTHPARMISKTLHALAKKPELHAKFISLDVLFFQNLSLFL